METIAFEEVSFTYPGCDTPTLQEISFGIQPAEFIVLCGKSGCGKSTLLRQIKPAMAPYGHLQGRILYRGKDVESLSKRTAAAKIGFVQQNPDNQIVTDQVWRELAFGLESLGCDHQAIRRRVAEMASFFNLQGWFRRETAKLSGGQKQLLNLASIMVMNPQVLILDEPTAQLDPIAASDFLSTLHKINRELGVTVLISEHRLEELFPMADRVMVMSRGRIVCFDTPRKVGQYLTETEESGMFYGLPAVMKVASRLGAGTDGSKFPLTVRESRLWMTRLLGEPEEDEESEGRLGQEGSTRGNPVRDFLNALKRPLPYEYAVLMDDVWFRYEEAGDYVLRGVHLGVKRGELFCLLGGNGVGKSTTMKALCGIIKPQKGTVHLQGTMAMVPQNPQALFTEITVKEELMEALWGKKLTDEEVERRALHMMDTMELFHMEEMHPYDLSGGEQQRLALGKILLLEPQILLLDEPTKGLDPFFKRTLAGILKRLTDEGVTILMVSHDVEFCAEYADRCGLFFDGELVSCGKVKEFFAGNRFYTTAANRMAGAWFPEAIVWEEVAKRCGEAMR